MRSPGGRTRQVVVAGFVLAVAGAAPRPASAQGLPPPPTWTITVNVTRPAVGGTTAPERVTQSTYGEAAVYNVAARPARQLSVDVALAHHIWRGLGVRVGMMVVQADLAMTIAGRVPSPLVFNTPRSVVGEQLLRHRYQEHAVAGVWTVSVRPRTQLTIGAGPSLFIIERPTVTAIEVVEDDPPYEDITLGAVDTVATRGKGVGFHGSVAVTYLVSPRVGISAMVRATTGRTVELSGGAAPRRNVQIGGLTVGTGLRIGW